MENLTNKILEIIVSHQVDETETHTHSTTGNQIIPADSFSELVNDIANLIQIVFDPENQPNQFGIENPFLPKVFDFDKAVEPAIRYLLKKHNPHTKIYIDYSEAVLLEGQTTHNLNNEVPD